MKSKLYAFFIYIFCFAETLRGQRGISTGGIVGSINKNERYQDEATVTVHFLILAMMLLVLFLVIVYYLRERRLANKFKKELDILRANNDSKDQLFSVISHDLRSSMYMLQINNAKMRTLLAKRQVREAATLAVTNEQITTSTLALLNNLLYWALSHTGQVNYEPQIISLKVLIEQVIYDYLPIAASKNIKLATDLNDANISCTIDLNSTKLVLRNLIDNAIKYTASNGRVVVAALELDNHCLVTVEDNGLGMDQQTIDAIFNSSTGRSQYDAYGRRSTGLGLWLAKNMVEKNNGKLGITSEKGVGTSVTISLPCS